MLNESINLLHKPHNAPVPYPTMQIGALMVISQMRNGICEMDELISNFSSCSFYWQKKSPRIDSHIGFDKRLRMTSFDLMTIINMHLW